MQKALIPNDEMERLRQLHDMGILDTPPEERFDRLIRVAKRMFGVSIASITMVDSERQWFKSQLGLDVPETPRDISFCGHAILGEDIFLVPDATQDQRFHDNPLVTSGPNIKFYAGFPLRAPGGAKLGTLCVIDQKPRTFDEDDIALLKDLAGMVEEEIASATTANSDQLTGLMNRRGFLPLAGHCLEFCQRHALAASLLFFDLNDFKIINDELGHAEGDKALKDFSDAIRQAFRGSDVAARLGGDEFVILMMEARATQVQPVVNRFKNILDQNVTAAGRPYKVAFSIGIAEFDPAKPATVEELMSVSDSAMYENKAKKKG